MSRIDLDALTFAMTEYYRGDTARINHFLKVTSFARMIAHHHDYASVSQTDHRILVEADFLVNAYESGLGIEAIRNAKQRIFETVTGRKLLDLLYGN